jgi:hypothetical protein
MRTDSITATPGNFLIEIESAEGDPRANAVEWARAVLSSIGFGSFKYYYPGYGMSGAGELFAFSKGWTLIRRQGSKTFSILRAGAQACAELPALGSVIEFASDPAFAHKLVKKGKGEPTLPRSAQIETPEGFEARVASAATGLLACLEYRDPRRTAWSSLRQGDGQCVAAAAMQALAKSHGFKFERMFHAAVNQLAHQVKSGDAFVPLDPRVWITAAGPLAGVPRHLYEAAARAERAGELAQWIESHHCKLSLADLKAAAPAGAPVRRAARL